LQKNCRKIADFTPCGNGIFNIDKSIEDIKWIIKKEIKEAKDVHYEVGKKVRRAIADIGGMMPEEMPTPKKSLKEIERERKQLENKEQKKLEEIK